MLGRYQISVIPVCGKYYIICYTAVAMPFPEMKEAILEECTKHGKVEECRIPTCGKGRGKVKPDYILWSAASDSSCVLLGCTL